VSEVLRFPPLPATPQPSIVPRDERQRTYYRVAGTLATQVIDGIPSFTDTTHGFRASAVDLGALQDILEAALARFDMQQFRERWDVDVRVWMAHTIAWIQRCKYVHFDVADNGVHITIETRDDRGDYRYELDVFPGRHGTAG
jgi:hypothetical protein